tara:strand:+ start:3478 stop:4404 length:927 start_codon:yes stop_codon:yes gene_type:complete
MQEGIQARLFKGLQTRIGGNESLVKWLATTLDIDISLANRKANGSVGLSLAQLELIIEALPLAVEDLLPNKKKNRIFVGSYSHFRSNEEIEDYLLSIIKNFEFANKTGAHLKYFARDLPLFYFFLNKELARFKFSMWTDQLRHSGLQRFNANIFNLCDEIAALYKSLHTTEMWNKEVMRNQREQINWYYGLQVISTAERDHMISTLAEVLVNYKKWAKEGQKEDGKFELYVTSFNTMNSGGLLSLGKHKQLMTALSGVFFISSANPSLTNSFDDQFNQQRSAATLLTQCNALSRAEFFRSMEDHLIKD